MATLRELIDKYPEDYRPVYEGDLLYIIRNLGNDCNIHDRSILGVFTSPESARNAIIDAKKRQERAGVKINMELKTVIPNTSMYHCCSAYNIKHLIDDPKSFEIAVRSWSNWEYILDTQKY